MRKRKHALDAMHADDRRTAWLLMCITRQAIERDTSDLQGYAPRSIVRLGEWSVYQGFLDGERGLEAIENAVEFARDLRGCLKKYRDVADYLRANAG